MESVREALDVTSRVIVPVSIAAATLLLLDGCSQTPGLPPTHDREWKPPQSDELGWNQWRGPKRDGLSPDTDLLQEWPDGGPPLVWSATGLGLGFSSVVIAGNRLFTMGAAGDAAQLFAVDASDGKVVWFARVGDPGGVHAPGPRSTPCTDGTLVFGLGHDGELVPRRDRVLSATISFAERIA